MSVIFACLDFESSHLLFHLHVLFLVVMTALHDLPCHDFLLDLWLSEKDVDFLESPSGCLENKLALLELRWGRSHLWTHEIHERNSNST